MTIFRIFRFIVSFEFLLFSCSFLYLASLPSTSKTNKRASLADFVSDNALKYIIINETTEQRAGAYTVIPCYNSKLLDWKFHMNRLRASLSLVTADSVSMEEIDYVVSSAISSAPTLSRQVSSLLSDKQCSTVFVVCVGYLPNNSTQLRAEARSFALPAVNFDSYGVNFALYSRSLPRAKAVDWLRERAELALRRDACGAQETLLYRADGIVTEGLVSNVIVLSDHGDLLCAEQDCLEGSMARIVKLASLRCGMRLDSAQGIPVPWTVGGPKWRAAVLCNSARGVIPVSHLQLPTSDLGDEDLSSDSLNGDGGNKPQQPNAVVFLNSRADDQVRSIQLLVHRFLRGDEGEDADEDVMYMSKQFRILYGYDPWTPLASLHR